MTLCLSLACSGLIITSSVFAADVEPLQAAAEKLVERINAADDMAIWNSFDPSMRKVLPKDKVKPFFNEVRQVGKITKTELLGYTGSGHYRLLAERGAWDMQLSLDSRGRINGLLIRPSKVAAPPARNSTRLRLPFNETWTVFWGGPTPEQNMHHDMPNQRAALDLVITGPDGRSHSGDGTKNSDFFCYGKEMLAPAAGTIIMLIDGVPENAPGSMNRFMATGNSVMIEHGPREFSFLAHMQPRLLRVKLGDKVQAGQVIGLCGNSGNSSEPHLHYHLQDSPVFQDGLGIEAHFDQVRLVRDGKSQTTKDYAPVKGDQIAPP